MKRLLLPLVALLCAGPAAGAPVRAPHVEAELVAEHTAWLPGAVNWVALRLKPDPGWHTYWRNPGDSGLATSLQWALPEGWRAGEILWPLPGMHRLGDLTNYGYDEETLHLVGISVPARPQAAQETVRALAKWLVCADVCIPGEAGLELTLPYSEIVTADPRWTRRFAEARARLPEPEPLPATFAVADGEVRVEVAAPQALAGAAHAEFFPFANDLVNHGAPQRLALSAGAARFAQAQSAFFAGAPARVEGVLVVHGGGRRAYSVSATAGEVAAVAAPAPAAPPEAAPPGPGLLAVLGFALLGGLILNLMPCVFPVLSIKAVSMLESRRGDPAAERRHGLAYTAGVVLSCVAAAAALLALRHGGEMLGWGFQLQSPVFVALLAYLMLALGLSLSGLVQFGTRLMGVGQQLAEKGGYAGSFFTGVLAVVVASPCTAPFMGTALGYALVQPAATAVLVFAVLGLGLALPFLLLGFFPALGAWLPRPGAWMETFKQLMAFPLYLTAVWLLWVLGRQAGIDAVALVLCGLVLVGFALWLWGTPPHGAARALLAAFAAGSERYSEERLAALRAQQRAVFVNFTADWCITCKVNEKAVFARDSVRAALAERKVVVLVADWTTADPAITAALARFGRPGVPLYVLYPPGGEPVILPQILTPELFIDALRQLP